MPTPKTRLNLHLDPELRKEVERMAKEQRRSLTGQIEVTLLQSIKAYAATKEAVAA